MRGRLKPSGEGFPETRRHRMASPKPNQRHWPPPPTSGEGGNDGQGDSDGLGLDLAHRAGFQLRDLFPSQVMAHALSSKPLR